MTATSGPETEDALTLAGAGRQDGAVATLRRGLRLVPELRRGLGVTLLFGLIATAGRVVVPLAVQQTLDRGLLDARGPDLGRVGWIVAGCVLAVILTAAAAYALNYRLFRTTETALAALRVRAFRRVHDLSMLHQQAQRRGSLVSRVTSDVDQMSVFMQWGGILIVVSSGQLLLATVLMAVYSWELTLLVWACFVPLALVLPVLQRRLAGAYATVRERIGDLLGAVSESVVGAQTVRAYGVEDRTADRIDAAIDRHYRSAVRAQKNTVAVFTSGELVAAVANAAVVVVGVLIGVGGGLTAGELVAFLFLVTLFIAPVQVASEALSEAQNALASFRRVLDVVDATPDVADPAGGTPLPPGPLGVRFDAVTFRYPQANRAALVDVDLELRPRSRVAVVGETGSGKTTFAKLLTRLMDPTSGRVLVGGVPLTEVPFSSLRSRVVMVPQDGFLFDSSVADNVRYGRPGISDAEVTAAFGALGLGADRGRPARRGPVGGGAAARRRRPGVRGRPGRAGPGRGDVRGRPGDGGPAEPGPGLADPGPDHPDHRAPAVHRGGGGRDPRRGRGPGRAARAAHGARRPGRGVRAPARLLGGPAAVSYRG
jgi:ATP-binding cassette subfamily B protein